MYSAPPGRPAQRDGQRLRVAALLLLAVAYGFERFIYYSVVGFRSPGRDIVFTLLLAGLGFLFYRGQLWPSILLAPLMALNGLGVPRGMSAVFGSLTDTLAYPSMALHLITALALIVISIALLIRRIRSRRRPTG